MGNVTQKPYIKSSEKHVGESNWSLTLVFNVAGHTMQGGTLYINIRHYFVKSTKNKNNIQLY